MSCKKFGFGLLVSVFALLLTSNANAITVNGTNYNNEFLSGDIGGYLGVWKLFDKGITHTSHPDDLTNKLSNMSLNGQGFGNVAKPTKFEMTFMTNASGYFGDVVSATSNLYDINGTLLLSLNYLNSGTFTGITAIGSGGEADLTGIFRVVGGSYFTSGLISGNLYGDFNWTTGSLSAKHDFYWTGGSFNLYSSARPPVNPVPEPATMTLMATGVAALIRKRKKSEVKA